MIKNYFKVALRYILRNKSYTVINVLGLAIGITCCMLIMLFIRSEWSYDRFHSKADRIYRAWLHENYEGETFTNTTTPIPMGPVFLNNIPEVESYCRVYTFSTLVRNQNEKFNESFNMVDSNFFKQFDFELIAGNPSQVFHNSQSMVITEEMAAKYFGKENAVGKNLELQLGDEMVGFTITGITKRAPQESSIKFDMLIPFSNARYFFSEKSIVSGWSQVYGETYIQLMEGKTGAEVEAKLPALVKQLFGEKFVEGQYNIHLQPMTDIHLNKELPAGNLPVSDPMYTYILGTLGILVLLIACINFVTLSVGRSATRALEVGVRKVMGAERSMLVKQFWGEALLMVSFSFVIAIGLAMLFLKPFNVIASKELLFKLDIFTILFFTGIIIIVGLIAGIYPAIVLSSFSPVKVLKGKMQSGDNMGLFRRMLITGQFIATIIMIIGTMVIGKQLDYLQNKNLGYNREHIVIIPTNKPRAEGFPLAMRLKTELQKNPQVVSSAASMFSFSEPGWISLGYDDDNKVFRQFKMNAVDADFVKTMKLEIIEGRNFQEDNTGDITNSMLVNEAMVKEYGWKNPIGEKLPGKYEQTVIGVVRDFHFESLHSVIKPVALVMRPDSMIMRSSDVMLEFSPQPRLNVRLKSGNIAEQLSSLKVAWKKVASDQDFEFYFLDESLNQMYSEEERLGTVVRYASILSIFIACMGLFGLVTLVVEKRTKEIGIRKVLGADIKNLVMLLSKDFISLVIIAALIASPFAWWALNSWLQDFAYRVSIDWWIFLVAAASALLIALITVSFQVVKAALANPVKSLRTE